MYFILCATLLYLLRRLTYSLHSFLSQANFFLSEEEIMAHNPAHSAVPRLHCLVAKVLQNKDEAALAAQNICTGAPDQKWNSFNFHLCPGSAFAFACTANE